VGLDPRTENEKQKIGRMKMGIEELIAYVNGEFVPQSEARLSVFDHGLLYGDGVFDTWCTCNGFIFKFEQHLDRLYRSIHAFQMDMPIEKDELKWIIIEVAVQNKDPDQYIKCMITRGVGPRPLLSPVGCKPSVVVFSQPYGTLISEEKQDRAIRAIIPSIRRTPAQCLDPKVKNLNYANLVLARMQALNAGVDEAILLDIHGFINEAPGFNLFTVQDNRLYTPAEENILQGVTRETVIEIAEKQHWEVKETRLIAYDLYSADEVFLASTAGGIVPIGEVDGRAIGTGRPGPVTLQVRRLYQEMLASSVHGTRFLKVHHGKNK